MSIHQSLKLKNQLSRNRNVMKRQERLEAMIRKGTFDPEKDSIYGLPKMRVLN